MKRTRTRSITTPLVTQEPCATRQSVYDDELQSLEGCIARLTETLRVFGSEEKGRCDRVSMDRARHRLSCLAHLDGSIYCLQTLMFFFYILIFRSLLEFIHKTG